MHKLALCSPAVKKSRAGKIADELEANGNASARTCKILSRRGNGLSEAMLDRTALTPARLKAIADDVPGL